MPTRKAPRCVSFQRRKRTRLNQLRYHVRDDQSEGDRFLRWTPIDGAIAYFVRDGTEIVARSRAEATEANNSSVPWYADKKITVTAVNQDGAESDPTVVPVGSSNS